MYNKLRIQILLGILERKEQQGQVSLIFWFSCQGWGQCTQVHNLKYLSTFIKYMYFHHKQNIDFNLFPFVFIAISLPK